MSPTDLIGWKQLKPHHSAKQQPKLFYLFNSSDSGLVLQLTDQIRLWQCSLTKADINSKAAEQHCSIDPSESAGQMNVFLCKLEQSLETGKNSLIRAAGSESDELCLFTHISLPHPLPPLAFSFNLRVSSPSLFSRTIVQPALATIATLQSQLSSLEHHIKDKDHIISKLLDRIKSQSIDMSMIFPTLTGAGGRNGTVTVEMAKKRITGMEAFDHEAWASEFDGLNGQLVRVGELLKGVHSEASENDVDEDWTHHLPSHSPAEWARMNTSQPQSQTRSQDMSGHEQGIVTSEDEFERRATPPSLRKKRASPKIIETLADQDSSSDRCDDPPPAKKQKIGGLKKKRPAIVKPEPMLDVESKASSAQAHDKQEPHPPSRSLSPVSDDVTETASSSSAEDKPTTPGRSQQSKQKTWSDNTRPQSSPSPSPSPTEHSPSPPPQRQPSFHASTAPRRLGRLGKKSQQRTDTASAPSEANTKGAAASQSTITTTTTATTTPTKRLGRIGINKQTQPQSKSRELADESATANDGDNDDDDDLDPRPFTQPLGKSPTVEMKKTETKRHTTDHSVLFPPPSSPPQQAPPPQPRPQPPAETKLAETEEQKAARRKEELRKMIASGPTKKKRRF